MTNNLSPYFKRETTEEKGNIAKIEKPVPLMWKLRQKTAYIPSINLETGNQSKTNYPSVSTSSRRANRRMAVFILEDLLDVQTH